MSRVRWIQTDGGPFIWLPYEQRAGWQGSDPPSGGRIVKATFRWDGQELASDYDAACDAAHPIGRVRHRDFDAIALERGPKAYLSGPRIIVHWDTGPDKAHVDALLRASFRRGRPPELRWKKTRLQLVSTGKLALFDAAYPGKRLPPHLAMAVPRGTYGVDAADWSPDDETALVLYRLASRGKPRKQ
jgi:hypothetical protein